MSIKSLLEDRYEKMEIQKMLDDFCDLTGLAAVISDVSGNMLTEISNVKDFCAIMRQQGDLCATSDEIGGKLAVKIGKACGYRCHVGLTDFAVPIFVDDKHVGNVLTGQVRTQQSLENNFEKTDLKTIDYDYEHLMTYYNAIPFMDDERFEKSTNLLNIISKYVENQIKLNTPQAKNELYTSQLDDFNDYKLKVELIVSCIKEIKYNMGKKLIQDLHTTYISGRYSKVNEGLFNSIFYYEMKNLKIELPEIAYFQNKQLIFYDAIFDFLFDQILESKCFMTTNEMDYAIAYIQRYSGNKMTSRDVAKFMNLSPDYFGRMFKMRFKESATDYIIRYKMGLAKLWLLQSDFSIFDIAMSLGYMDSNYFSRVFKKSIGISPKKYRVNMQVSNSLLNKMTE